MEPGGMGGGTPWGAIAQGGGAVLGALSNAAAARKKNRILAEGSRLQNRAGMEAAGVMGDFVTRLRESAPNPAVERNAFTAALDQRRFNPVMNASKQFQNDAAAGANAARGYGTNLASLFARIRAPQLQRQGESELLQDMGTALRPIQMRAQDDEFMTNLRAGMVQPNPWVGLGSSLLQQGGSYATKQGY